MRTRAILVFLVLPACDDTLGNSLTSDATLGGSGLPDPDATGWVTTTTGATQVGSEGFWGCPIEKLDPIDPDVVIDAYGGPPAPVVDAHLGDWPLVVVDLSDPGTTLGGALTLTVGSQWRSVDVTDGPTCSDHVAVDVSGTLQRGSGPAVVVGGVVAVRPDGVGAVVIDAPVADADAAWGVPPTGATVLRLEGDLGTSSLSHEASFADCASTDVVCPGRTVVSSVSAAR